MAAKPMKRGATLMIAAVVAIVAAMVPAAAQVTDADILNFALNLEYLEGEFYACATTGSGLPSNLRGGGPASIGCEMANLTGSVAAIATEISRDETNHVAFLRGALGAAAVPIPLLNIGTGSTGAFSIAANAALNTTLSPAFTPYANNLFFLHGAFIFEDVGVTAYEGAAALINSSAYLEAAAGILAVEAYHAGSIREQLIQNGSYVVQPYNVTVDTIVDAISALRAALSGMADDQGILGANNGPNLTPVNADAYTFPRTPAQILSIVTAGSTNGTGLFYPNGLNGAINGSAASMALVAGRRKMLAAEEEKALVATTSTRKLQQTTITDADILNFALNLEYLEAEYYTYATTGSGIPAGLLGNGSAPTTGGMMANLSAPIQALATEIAADEVTHVAFLRAALGAAAVPKPALNIGAGTNGSFSLAADAAFNMTLDPPFNPYANDVFFVHGAFIFEDVGVTAYKGAADLISSKAYLTAAAGILAVEAYHAGAVRTLLYQNASYVVPYYGVNVSTVTGAIAALRDLASGSPVPMDDFGVTNGSLAVIAADDTNSIAFSRSPAQVISIGTLASPSGMGGFFPEGLNGPINGTSSSIGSVSALLSGASTTAAPPPPVSSAASPSASTPASAAPSPSTTAAAPSPSTSTTGGTPTSSGTAATPTPSGTAATPTPSSTAAAPTSSTTAPAPAPSGSALGATLPSAVAVVIGVLSTLALLA